MSGQPEGTAKKLTGLANEERRPIKDRWGNVWGLESHLLSPLTELTEDRSTTAASLSTRPSNMSLGDRSAHSMRSVHSNNSLLQRLNSADLNSLRMMRSQSGLREAESPDQRSEPRQSAPPESTTAPPIDTARPPASRSHSSRVIVSTVAGPFTPPVTDEDLRARFSAPTHQHPDESEEDSDAIAAREERLAKKEQRRQRRKRREERKADEKKRAETLAEKQLRRRMAKDRKEEFLRQKSFIVARLQASPNDPEHIRSMGELYLQSDGGVAALKLAVRHLEASLQIDDTDPRCWQLLGRAWAKLYDAPESATYKPTEQDRKQQEHNATIGFRKAIVQASYEDAVSFKNDWADYLYSRERYSDAIVVLQEAARNEGKNDPQAFVNLGLMYYRLADESGTPFSNEERLTMLNTAEAYTEHAVKMAPGDGFDMAIPMIKERREELEDEFGIVVPPTQLRIGSAASSKQPSKETLASPEQSRGPAGAKESTDGGETETETETTRTGDGSGESAQQSVTTSSQTGEPLAASVPSVREPSLDAVEEPTTPRAQTSEVGHVETLTPPDTPKASLFRAPSPHSLEMATQPVADGGAQADPIIDEGASGRIELPAPIASRPATPASSTSAPRLDINPPSSPSPSTNTRSSRMHSVPDHASEAHREETPMPGQAAEHIDDDFLDDPTSALLELDAAHRARTLDARRRLSELEEQHERERSAFLDRLRRRRANSGASLSLGVGYSPAHTGLRSVSAGALPLRSPAPSYSSGTPVMPFDRSVPRDYSASSEAMQRMIDASRSGTASPSQHPRSGQQGHNGGRNEAADIALQAISAILRLANPQAGF